MNRVIVELLVLVATGVITSVVNGCEKKKKKKKKKKKVIDVEEWKT